MQIFQQEYDDGIAEVIRANASISYASALEPCDKIIKSRAFKALASMQDSDLYYTQSILVSSSWNKNDDIFDKDEVWAARHSPEHKPTNLEHDEGIIIGHIVSNYPITEDGILIDENTPIENLPNKYHILTGSVIYKSYTKPELKERTEKLISEIENGTKYVSMECFFKGFDYGLINKETGDYKVLARDNNTAYLTKYLRAYGGMGEHENYRIGRVLKDITFSGKGYVDKPANPDSIIFSKDEFKFLSLKEKNDDFTKSGVTIFQSTEQPENNIMSTQSEAVTVDCTEATEATISQLTQEIESIKSSHEETINTIQSEKDKLVSELEAVAKEHTNDKEKMKKMEEKNKEKEESMKKMKAELDAANEVLAAYKEKEAEMMKKEKKMKRMATLTENGLDQELATSTVEKFEDLDDTSFDGIAEVFAAMMKSMKKEDAMKMKKMTKADEVENKNDITEALETVETTEEIIPAVGGEEVSEIESTRAALVDFVCNRLGKKLNKGE
jgi:hypothetical protein